MTIGNNNTTLEDLFPPMSGEDGIIMLNSGQHSSTQQLNVKAN